MSATARPQPAPSSAPSPDLVPGRLVELGVTEERAVRWYRTRLESYEPAAGRIVVAWPTERLRPVPLAVGQPLLLGLPTEDEALIAAAAHVQQTSAQEPPLVTLHEAGPWQRTQRRSHVRFPVSLKPTALERDEAAGGQALSGIVQNISAGGVFLRCAEKVQAGERLAITFRLPDDGPELSMRLEVARVQIVDRAGVEAWEAGCRFRDPEPAACDRIIRFIFAQQRQLARRLKGLY